MQKRSGKTTGCLVPYAASTAAPTLLSWSKRMNPTICDLRKNTPEREATDLLTNINMQLPEC